VTRSAYAVWESELKERQGEDRSGTVWLWAEEFTCRVCGLLLEITPEVAAAGMDLEWEIKGANPFKYEP